MAVSTLLSELSTLHSQFTANPVQARESAQHRAVELACERLLTSDAARSAFEDNARASASEGRKTCRLVSWRLTDDLRFNGRYLLDLLNRSELLGILQDWLDEHYGTGLRVFHHKVSGSTNEFSLTVSWDPEGFADIDDIIRRNREMASMPPESRRPENTSYRGAPRGRGGMPSRGGRGAYRGGETRSYSSRGGEARSYSSHGGETHA